MKTHFFLMTLILGLFTYSLSAQYTVSNTAQDQPAFQWPEGVKMALSLTFDDARLTQIDKGIPLLDKYDVKATFYISPLRMMDRIDGWKKAINKGHEVGNHSILHPCSGNFPFARNRALENYTIEAMHTELDSASRFIREKLGVQPVSFAYPCGQTFVGRGLNTKSYIPIVASLFETGRGWMNEGPNDPAFCDMAHLTGMKLDGQSFEQILRLIESAKTRGQWLILAGHEMSEVYTEGALISILDTIEAICKYASDPANGVWIDNVQNIAAYVKEKRGEVSASKGL